jgi:hypothetical protein
MKIKLSRCNAVAIGKVFAYIAIIAIVAISIVPSLNRANKQIKAMKPDPETTETEFRKFMIENAKEKNAEKLKIIHNCDPKGALCQVYDCLKIKENCPLPNYDDIRWHDMDDLPDNKEIVNLEISYRLLSGAYHKRVSGGFLLFMGFGVARILMK